MELRCLFHIHTRRSLDSLLSPRKIIARARQENCDVLVITDHETVLGSEDVMRLAEGNPRFVIRGAEYKTEKGDLIGLLLRGEIRTRKSNELIREIRAQDGLVVLPHPYKGHALDEELLEQIDLVETFNGRCAPAMNESARMLAEKLGKPELAGCDAHCSAEIGAAVTVFHTDRAISEADLPALFRVAPRQFQTARVSAIYQPYSGMIKAGRTLDVPLFGYQLKRMVSVFSQEFLST